MQLFPPPTDSSAGGMTTHQALGPPPPTGSPMAGSYGQHIVQQLVQGRPVRVKDMGQRERF